MCATGDVHFLDPEDEIYRHILLASKQFKDADSPLPIYFKTTDEMLEEFSYLGEEDCRKVVIDDPNRIAKWVDVVPPLPKGLFAPKLKDSAKELEYLVYDKAHSSTGRSCPRLSRTGLTWSCRASSSENTTSSTCPPRSWCRTPWSTAIWWAPGAAVGSSIVAFLSGITEVNSLPAHYRCPKCKHSDFEAGKAYGCGADMPDAWCPGLRHKIRQRTALISPSRPSWASAAKRCRIST